MTLAVCLAFQVLLNNDLLPSAVSQRLVKDVIRTMRGRFTFLPSGFMQRFEQAEQFFMFAVQVHSKILVVRNVQLYQSGSLGDNEIGMIQKISNRK